ncbi:MAG: M23 family metallopeptidase [Armatimonadetes bacterium]|nr:M23 family metallopeptidase [Armatimonadota bacterium]
MRAAPANGAGIPGLGEGALGAAAPGGLPDAGGAGGAAAAAAPAAAPAGAPATGRGGFSKPLDNYKVTSEFGPRGSENHGGIDLAAPTGTPVKAAKDGTVSISRDDSTGYGSWIEIKHDDGSSTRYGHLSARDAQVGQRVAGGQVIGKVGSTGRSTGPHLHFEIRQGGQAVDPKQYLGF